MEINDLPSSKSSNFSIHRAPTNSQRLNLVDITSTEQPLDPKKTLPNNQLSFSPEPRKRVVRFVGKNALGKTASATKICASKTKIALALVGLFVVVGGVIVTVLLVKSGKDHNLKNNNNNGNDDDSNVDNNNNNNNNNNGNNNNNNGNNNNNIGNHNKKI